MDDSKSFGFGSFLIAFIVFAFILWMFVITFFSVKVSAGFSGILIDQYGSDKGVQITGLHTGRNFYNSITHDAEVYPIFMRQTEYGNMEFQDTDGLIMGANVGVSYRFIEDKIGTVYETYRADADKITDTYMRTWTRDAMNRVSSAYTVDVLYGEKKEEFRAKVNEMLQKDLVDKGILVERVYFVGAFSLPEVVSQRINAKIEATQKAIQAENELRTTEAEAKKKIAEAEGDKQSKILTAQGNAEAIRIQAAAIQVQGGADYIKLKWIEQVGSKWQGEVPATIMGGDVPFMNMLNLTK